MSTIDLDAIRARANAATPGPWGVFWDTRVSSEVEIFDDGSVRYRHFVAELDAYDREEAGEFANPISPAVDAEFIAHGREDIPALLAEVDRLRADNDGLRHMLGQLNEEATRATSNLGGVW